MTAKRFTTRKPVSTRSRFSIRRRTKSSRKFRPAHRRTSPVTIEARPSESASSRGPASFCCSTRRTNAAVRSVAVGKQPHWVATAGDGKKAYVTNEGSNDVTIVDLATGKTTTDRGGQRAAQGRRAGRRGECREGNVG